MCRIIPCVLFAVALIGPVTVGAQRSSKNLPRTPAEALERASEPLRKAYQSGTFEDQARAYGEQKRRAAEYALLFRVERLKGKELLNLAELYWYAEQVANAERALLAYLKGPDTSDATRARTLLLRSRLNQKKLGEAVPVAEALLGEPKYDSDTLIHVQNLISALRVTDPSKAIALAETMLPKLFVFAEGKAESPHEVISQLQSAFENGEIYRDMGDGAKAEAYFASFLSRFNSSPLASNKVLRRIIDFASLRARLPGTVPSLEGIEYIDMPKTDLAGLKGKVIMLDFLAHWCPQCIADFPYTNALQEKYGSKGLVVIGLTEFYGHFGGKEEVSRDEELAELRKLKSRSKVGYGLMIVPKKNTEAFGVSGLPAVALLDRKGKIRYLRQGADYKQSIEKEIQKLLSEPGH